MEPVNWQSWRRRPKLCIRQGWGIEGTLKGTSDWGRSGNESSWQKPMSNVETPLRPHRPNSCIEGSSITWPDQWLEMLETTNGRPVYCEGQTFTERAGSMSVPPKERFGQERRRHSDIPALPISWNTTLKTSEERQTAHLKCLPKGQPIRSCALAAVQTGWLPVQSRAVLCNLPSRPNMSRERAAQAPFNSVISSIMPENLCMKNGTELTDGGLSEVHSQRGDTMSSRKWHFPGQAPVKFNQESRRSFVSVGSHLTASQKGQLKEWKTTLPTTPLSLGCAELSRENSRYRTTSAPEDPSLTVTHMGGITGLSKMKSGFSSITIASRKVPQSTDKNKSARPEHSAPVDTPVLRSPVVYRRKATAIKVTSRRQSYTVGEVLEGAHPTIFRHSYAEGDSKENSLSPLSLQSSGSLLHESVSICNSPNVLVEPICSTASLKKSEEPGGGEQKIHRSTLSLYLSSPSSGASSGSRLRRSLSFTGGLSQTNDKAADLEPRRRSLGPSGESNNDNGAAPASNTPIMQERPTHGDMSHPPVQKAKDPGLLNLWNPARNPHPAYIRARDNGWRHSPDLTLALNAASVIAYIKRQSQLKKSPVILPSKNSKTSRDSCSLVLEDAGRCTKAVGNEELVGPCPGGVMRKGTAGPAESGSTWVQLLDNPQNTLTLQEALVHHRPDFIRRSRGRLQELKRRMQERRTERKADLTGNSGGGCTRPHQLSDNHGRPQERGVMNRFSDYKGLADAKRRKEENKRKVVSQTNRMRVNVFKKKLLDQILQRKSD